MIVAATDAEVHPANITTQGANVSEPGTAGITVTGLSLDIPAESLGADIIALVLIAVDMVKTDHELMSIDFVGDFWIRIHKIKAAATRIFPPPSVISRECPELRNAQTIAHPARLSAPRPHMVDPDLKT